MKAHDMGTQDGERWIAFHCPGCEGGHAIPVTGQRAWGWNGSLESPTFTPSILVNVGRANPTQHLCHSIITDGRIAYCSDTTHKFSGQTIEMPDFEGE
jgi:hypothetical protein